MLAEFDRKLLLNTVKTAFKPLIYYAYQTKM